ncbi:MAG TPA: hypothetical protein VIJ16_03030, partial [Gemmatimonadaceae bacterium]
MIVHDPRIISSEWMIIGRQVPTSFGGRVDLLAIAPDGALVLIELKRDRSPRDLVAQAIDYASWVETLGPERIAETYRQFSDGAELDEAFRARFGFPLDEDALNQSHQIVVVAAELDNATERIIAYLNARDVAINAVLFEVFEFEAHKLLSRAWFIDPTETHANVATATSGGGGAKEPWNGEYYVSFGDLHARSWEDARKYGFVSGGGGTWFNQTLLLLSPGDRVWVRVPAVGYVGVGRVTERMTPAKEFSVTTSDGKRPALDVLSHADRYRLTADDPERSEYFVGVEWLDTVPEGRAANEVGLFGNQNTVCRPRAPLWRHTVERLKTYFPNWNGTPGP